MPGKGYAVVLLLLAVSFYWAGVYVCGLVLLNVVIYWACGQLILCTSLFSQSIVFAQSD